MDKINVLVTGCGGDIGQSIGKILLEFDLIDTLHGMDISDHNAAPFIFPNFHLGVRCSHPDYLSKLNDFVIEHNIDLVIPVSEPEIRFFSNLTFPILIGKAKIIVASKDALLVGFDKYLTAKFLKENNLKYPFTELLSPESKISKFPVIVKSRTGAGSKDVMKINSDSEMVNISKHLKGFIIQEYIEDEEGEFTCCLYRSTSGITRTIILKRELLGGFSGYGEVVKNKKIEDLLLQMADYLKLIGSINVQLRLKDGEPMVFEINPRFSSTVRFRDLLGFKDVIWSIQDIVGMDIAPYQSDNLGKRFYKGFNEYIN